MSNRTMLEILQYALEMICHIQLFQRKTYPPIPQQFDNFEWKMHPFESKHVILQPCAERL